MSQQYEPEMTVHVRSAADPMSLLGAVREQVAALDPGLSAFNVRTLREQMGFSLLPARVAGAAFAAFGILGLGLALLGLYGVVSHSVGQRLHELGVRMALGARAQDVVGMVVREGMQMVLLGQAVGLVVALAAARLLAGILYGLSPTDPATFVGIALLLAAVALAASYLPARRAAHVDPVAVLRTE